MVDDIAVAEKIEKACFKKNFRKLKLLSKQQRCGLCSYITWVTLDIHEFRGLVSMGAVGASAPMLFKVVGASTHTFWQLFLFIPTENIKQIEGLVQITAFLNILKGAVNSFLGNEGGLPIMLMSSVLLARKTTKRNH